MYTDTKQVQSFDDKFPKCNFDSLKLVDADNEFVHDSEHRLLLLGKFRGQ